MIKLSKQFSRERSVFYCSMWRDSDALGFSKFLNYEVQNILFLKKPKSKISVWFNNEELEEMKKIIGEKMNPDLLIELESELTRQWEIIAPFIRDDKSLENIKDLEEYYRGIVNWWSAMTIIFFAPDIAGIPEEIKKRALILREEGEKYSSRMDKVFIKFWISKYKDAKDLSQIVSPAEIFKFKADVLAKGTLLELQKRLEGFVFLNGIIYPLSELDSILKKLNLVLEDEKDNIGSQSIQGTPACIGKAIGEVKLIALKSQLDQFKDGQILVTEMTDPDYISVIKKSNAIITDEGGITCHAAIVARELKKPCIIGTKIATQVLHDGDLVEVDADNGIVKIIKKAN